MTSSIADKTAGSSSGAKSRQDSAGDHVVIVPPATKGSSPGKNADIAADPPFVGESQDTVLSKMPPESGNHMPFHPILKQEVVTPAEMGAMLLGADLGHFRLEEFVGGGGMGAVFRATDTKLGRTVAVKVLSKDRTDEDTLRRFDNEAQSAARLDHGNIARVYYVGEDQGLHYIVFEFIEGTNIRDLVRMRGGPLPVEEAISYVLQVAEALEHASMRNVIHRDIKPSNVLVTADRRAKLVDMGLARLHQMESDAEDITASGVTLGTFDYISPEQARDPREADVRSDLYSLGCTFYFMLTSRPPFPEGTVLQKLLSHSTEEPTDPRMLRSDLDEQVVKVLDRLLAKQPSKRYQRPSELIGHLLLVAERLNLRTISSNGAVWVAPRRRAHEWLVKILPWGIPILLFLVAALVIGRVWVPPRDFEFDDPAIQLQPALPSAKPDGQSAIEPEAGDAVSLPPASGGETDDSVAIDDSVVIASVAGPQNGSSNSATAEVPGTSANDGSIESTNSSEPPLENESDEGNSAVSGMATESDTEPTSESVETSEDGNPPPMLEQDSSGTSDAESTEVAQPVPVVQIDRIVVTDTDENVAGALLVPTLAEACRDAQQLGISRIELHYNGQRTEEPFEIVSENLTICAGEGYSPQLVFRDFELSGSPTSPAMILCNGKKLLWQGVHVLFESTTSQTGGGSVFRLRSAVSFDLRDSVVTVQNVDAAGVTVDEQLSFFTIVPRPVAEETSTTPEVPRLMSLSNSLLRGQATVVRAEHAAPFRLHLGNCLVAVRGRLVDVEGAAEKPDLKDGRIDLVMKDSTAALSDGLCRLTSDQGVPYLVGLHTEIMDSIVFVTNSQAPLFERIGAERLKEVENQLDLRGRDNFYPGSTKLLRLRSFADSENSLEIDFESRDQLPFLEEKNPSYVLMWADLPAGNHTEDRHTAYDYELDNSDFNPGIRMTDGRKVGVGLESLAKPPVHPAVDED